MHTDLTGTSADAPAPALEPGETLVPGQGDDVRQAPGLAHRLSAILEVIIVSGLPTQLVIMVGLTAAGLAQTGEDGELSRTFVAALLLADTVIVLALIAAFLRASRDPWRDVLLGRRLQGKELLLGLALVPLVFIGVAAVMLLLHAVVPGLRNVPTNPFATLVRTGPDALLMGGLAVLSGGIKEEIQRAFVLRRFGQFLGGERLGLLVFSLAFGAGHLMQGWDVGVVTTLLGAFWGILYLRRRSISASVASHSGFNVAQIVQFLVAGS